MIAIGPLLLIIILVAVYVWWSKQPHHIVQAPGEKGLPPDLERWTAAGLLSTDEAKAIVAFETSRVPVRKIPLFAEALGYIGAVLAMAGGGVALGQVWEDLTDLEHAGILASAGLAALVAGWLVRGQSEPAMKRMMSVLWILSVAGVAATLAIVFVDMVETSEDALALVIGGGTAVYASVLWWLHRGALQQFATFAAGLATVIGVAIILPGEAPAWVYALIAWAYGGAWLALGWYAVVEPAWGALGLGAVVAAFGPSIDSAEHGWLLGVGLVTAVLFMTLSISGRRLPLLGVGAIASFGYMTNIVVRYFGDALGIPLALAIVGIVVLGLAVLFGRSGLFGGSGWHHPTGHAV